MANGEWGMRNARIRECANSNFENALKYRPNGTRHSSFLDFRRQFEFRGFGPLRYVFRIPHSALEHFPYPSRPVSDAIAATS